MTDALPGRDAEAAQRRVRTLLFSTLYPSSVRPVHGIFVETRLRELLRTGQIDTRVVAPVPWFPSTHARYGSYALMARTPHTEVHNGVSVAHPRYFLPPKVGMLWAPLLLALGSLPTLRQIRRDGFDFDLIDAHYYYPDGVAAAILAHWLGKPCVVTARGSDLNLVASYAIPRRMIQWAASRAHASIGVSSALVDVLGALGVPQDRLFVMRNGVDLERFQPLPQAEARAVLGLGGAPVLLSVGNLLPVKGHDLVLRMFKLLLRERAHAQLVIVGAGPERDALEALASELQVATRVRFAGAQPNADLHRWYSAADLLVMASSREGWPNVLLEAMACGTPVVVSRVGGTPEIVSEPVAGYLVDERTPEAFCAVAERVLQAGVDRSAVRSHAEKFGWGPTSMAQLDLFRMLVRAGRT